MKPNKGDTPIICNTLFIRPYQPRSRSNSGALNALSTTLYKEKKNPRGLFTVIQITAISWVHHLSLIKTSQEIRCHDFFILLLIFVSSSSTVGVFESGTQQSGNPLKADCKNSKKPSTNSLKVFASKDKKAGVNKA